ncbi:3'-phosphoesterase [Candidatus Woesearchaeota archaeon]|nr:3'-phosphoesterase [Candidatus Woesearchaeota archaeon]
MPRFVVQEHDASKLHWDFRLELDNVLKSWAIPKKPPIKPDIKRLAILVEDHDLNYIDFEGEIPEGLYGAGTVKIWDKGTYEMDSRTDKKLVFYLNGKKLKGKYVLLKFEKAGENNWLFFKAKN